MGIELHINRGWIYLTPIERRCISEIINLLENTDNRDKRLHTRFFQDRIGVSAGTTAHALNILMSVHVIKPQQYGRVRLYSLCVGWRERLKKHIVKNGKDKIEQPEEQIENAE
jgi:hypothetical protein